MVFWFLLYRWTAHFMIFALPDTLHSVLMLDYLYLYLKSLKTENIDTFVAGLRNKVASV